ncbi:MAG: hypothetical protein K0Q87_4758 [Neobacillus sp.]|jgi:hypothetical protein|nr:hypothetical protein [Neobacillus sp.]
MGNLEIQIETYTQMIENCSDWILLVYFMILAADYDEVGEQV